jgi:putative endonuclease
MKTTKIVLGKQGEQAASAFLTRQGYTLVEANWRAPQGEFDLVMRDGDTLVFVEVKTRRASLESAFESISPRKKRILEQLAYQFLAEKHLDSDWRIDVIAVTLSPTGQPIIEHIQDAFDW